LLLFGKPCSDDRVLQIGLALEGVLSMSSQPAAAQDASGASPPASGASPPAEADDAPAEITLEAPGEDSAAADPNAAGGDGA
jgi:hypothetical protein